MLMKQLYIIIIIDHILVFLFLNLKPSNDFYNSITNLIEIDINQFIGNNSNKKESITIFTNKVQYLHTIGHLPSSLTRPFGSRTAGIPAVTKARRITSLILACRDKRPALLL